MSCTAFLRIVLCTTLAMNLFSFSLSRVTATDLKSIAFVKIKCVSSEPRIPPGSPSIGRFFIVRLILGCQYQYSLKLHTAFSAQLCNRWVTSRQNITFHRIIKTIPSKQSTALLFGRNYPVNFALDCAQPHSLKWCTA